MTETERNFIIPNITGEEPDIRKLMPDIGEKPNKHSRLPEDLGGMTGIVLSELLLHHRFTPGISEAQIAALIAYYASGQVEIPNSDINED